MHIDRLKGLVNAPEFPKGLNWFNTDYPLLLNDFKGKIVLLDFWTYCCINCHHVLPELKRLEAEFPNELVVIGVHSAKFSGEKDSENIREAVLRHNIQHPVVNDHAMTIWRHYAIRAWPSFVLINPAGRIVGQSSGEGIYPKVQPIIQQLITVFGADDMINHSPVSFTQEATKKPKTLLSFPAKLAIDEFKNKLFIVDSSNNRIIVTSFDGQLKMIIGSGDIGFKDGLFSEAQFNQPQGLTYHNGKLYVADTENHAIRVIDFEKQEVSTLIGNGNQAKKFNVEGGFSEISLNSPWDIEAKDDRLFVAMAGPHQIWELNLSNQKAQVWAGTGGESLRDGPRKEALLAQPSGLCFLADDLLVFADSETSAIRSVGISDNASVQTYVGEGLFDYGDIDGIGKEARLQHPLSVVAWNEQLLVADTYNNKIKLLNPDTKEVQTIIGTGESGMRDGAFEEATLNEPNGLAIVGNTLFIADTNNHLIRLADLEKKQLSTLQLSNTAVIANLRKHQLVENFAKPEPENLLNTVKVLVQKNALKWTISLPETMKLNDMARSVAFIRNTNQQLTLPIFDTKGAFELDQLDVVENEVIWLSGSVYYCEKNTANVGQCFVHEFEQRVILSKDERSNSNEQILVKVPDYDSMDLF